VLAILKPFAARNARARLPSNPPAQVAGQAARVRVGKKSKPPLFTIFGEL
jgi:hypothetical protein